MWMEIGVCIIAVSFFSLTVFVIIYLLNLKRTIKKVNELVVNMNRLTLEIQENVEVVSALLKPLEIVQRKISETEKGMSMCVKIAEVLEALAQGVLLFAKIKEELKDYVRSR